MSEFQLDETSRKQRRTAISQHTRLTGLDFIEVNFKPLRLLLHFIPAAQGIEKTVVPANIKPENIKITSGLSTTPLNFNLSDVEHQVGSSVLRIDLMNASPSDPNAADSSSLYTLELVNVPNLDRFFSQATFSLETDRISEFDSVALPRRLPKPPLELEIDYLARDYGSFRQLMLDRLSVLMPEWREHHPADLGTTLVEVLAYAGDRLSYYQDAVATEAYLGTARRRISVKRHAQLIDYRMHEGCNARAWVQIQIRGDHKASLPPGTLLATKTESAEPTLAQPVYQALKPQLQMFETLHVIDLVQTHNQILFYDWGLEEFYLPKGAISAVLQNGFSDLKVGDVLILEEILSPTTGQAEDANINHRHPIRLTNVAVDDEDRIDPLRSPGRLTQIEWITADALPFPLFISRRQGNQILRAISVARGNIVLAEHGRRIKEEPLSPVPERQRYCPRLQQAELTHAVPYDHAQAQTQPASSALVQDPRDAIPMINLYENEETWWARRDLLSSDRFACDFVVETESDGFAYLRFGDGVRGKQPKQTSHLSATYRVGNGTHGNVGQHAIAHLIPADADPLNIHEQIIQVRNPLPAQGGTDPENIEQVRLYAPQVFHAEQQRCINADDYKWMTERHPEVQQASAVLRWTGSWYTAFVAVKRRGNQPIDPAFQQTLLNYLERYRLAGYDLKIVAPQYVPIDIALTVKVAAGYFASTVKQSLLEAFSNADLPNGQQGFFHPDRFTFGQSVYFSQVVQAAMQVPGVAGVYLPQQGDQPVEIKFQRWGAAAQGELENGKIPISSLEIARLDNTASAPNNGRITFHLQGGL
ncbi:putative baseplate assembly protein [Leptolyngbya sp. FACHB-16]|uniref:putative baseplate assembly protein n=1 Tax=unclassified Leptolyngbya TaxID=2650499 RepID=UPI0016838867|nr:putative baseplate assembly protein [Leptolyngbya sp. FACHB-16]MBD2158531.1 putative baseplate assembly protein [Leptolyngbya sp. FACHB-16]